MFEFSRFELVVHDSAGGVVFRVVTWIIIVIIGAVRKRPLTLHVPDKFNGVVTSSCPGPGWGTGRKDGSAQSLCSNGVICLVVPLS